MKKMIAFMHVCLFMMLMISYPVHAQTSLKDVVYTSYSGKGSAETGTMAAPYSKFEDALANVADGGTIYVLSGSTSEYGFINEQSGSNGPLVIDKNVTIEPAGGADVATLSCRAAGILLEADVTFKNIELNFASAYHDHIYANGYHLTLDNVTRYQGTKIIDLVAGGLYDVTTGTAISSNEGDAAIITIKGKNSKFGNIYAGGMNGGYVGDVAIELESIGITSINEIYACGATEPIVNTDNFFDFAEPDYPTAQPTQHPVAGAVKISMVDSGVLYVYGTGASKGTEVSYNTTYLRTGQTLDSISKVTVEKGTVQPKVLTAPEGQNVDVEIQKEGIFDISNYETFDIDNFVGGGKLVVAQDSLVTIHESASGNTVFETSNSVMRYGAYIKMPLTSTAIFSYTPIYDQKGWKLEASEDESWMTWNAVAVDTIYISYWADEKMGTVDIMYEILLPEEKADGATAIPNEGYHFVKWVNMIDSETQYDVSTEATFVPTWGENYELEYFYDALFAVNTYNVEFDSNGGVGTMKQQDFTYGVEQSLDACEITREGYEFIEWNTKQDGTGISYTNEQIVKNLTQLHNETIVLYAQWKNLNAGGGTESGGGTENGGDTENGSGTENDNGIENGDGAGEDEGSSGVDDSQPNNEFDVTKVKNVKIAKVTYNTVTVSWDAKAGVSEYEIYRSNKKSSGYKKIATVAATTYKNTQLKTGKKYYYKVRGVSKEQQSAFSDVVTGKPTLTKPVIKTTKGKKRATITYGKVKGAQGYEIYRSTKKKKGFKKVVTTKKNRYVNRKLKSKKTYYYKVRAYRKVDGKKVYSSFSKVKAVKVIQNVDSNLLKGR